MLLFQMENESQAIFLYLFTICSSCKQKLVICPFVDKETNGSYPVCKRTKWTCPAMVSSSSVFNILKGMSLAYVSMSKYDVTLLIIPPPPPMLSLRPEKLPHRVKGISWRHLKHVLATVGAKGGGGDIYRERGIAANWTVFVELGNLLWHRSCLILPVTRRALAFPTYDYRARREIKSSTRCNREFIGTCPVTGPTHTKFKKSWHPVVSKHYHRLLHSDFDE